MTISAFFAGLFAIFEAVPILRDGFLAALHLYFEKKIEAAREQRTEGGKELENAKTIEEYQKALGTIIRGKSV